LPFLKEIEVGFGVVVSTVCLPSHDLYPSKFTTNIIPAFTCVASIHILYIFYSYWKQVRCIRNFSGSSRVL